MDFKIVLGGRGAILRTFNIVSKCGEYYVGADRTVMSVPPTRVISFMAEPGSFSRVEAEAYIRSHSVWRGGL